MSDAPDRKEEALKLNAGRGPNYPSITLREAIVRVMKFKEANAARLTVPLETAFRVIGFKGASGASRPVIASLNYYGLLDYVGRGDDRKVKLSDLAIKIIFDPIPGSPDRAEALQEAALKPAIHARLADELKIPPPADVVIERFLVVDCEYSESAAKTIIDVYKDTLEFAGLNKPVNINEEQGNIVDLTPPATMIDDALKGIGGGIGKPAMTPAAQTPAATSLPPIDPAAMKVALDGDKIVVSAVVGLRDAKRLLKRLQANIALLEEESQTSDDGEEAAH